MKILLKAALVSFAVLLVIAVLVVTLRVGPGPGPREESPQW